MKLWSGWRWIACIVFLLIALVGCGSPSGGSGGTTPSTTRTLLLGLTLTDSAGGAITRLEVGSTARIQITASVRTVVANGDRVSSDTTVPAGNLIVQLASDGASFEPSTGRVLTDAQGAASATLVAGTSSGAQTLTATTSLDALTASRSVNYEIVRSAVPRVGVRLIDAGGRDTNTLRSGDLVTVAALVEDVLFVSGSSGAVVSRTPRAGVAVNFSSDGGLFDPAAASGLTDNAGVARVRFQAGNVAGAFSMGASAAAGGATALSSSSAFQISAARLQLGSGNPFVAGRLASSSPDARAGEAVVISAEVRSEDGLVYALPVDVSFSSACASAGSAQLPASARSSGGRVSVAYTPLAGCNGQDRISAVALQPGQSLGADASLILSVLPPEPAAIRYVDADTLQLGLVGRSTVQRPDRSAVRFRVSNASGIPVAGARVRFSLSSAAGGLGLISSSALTDANGVATATVLSGTRSTSFRVIASLDAPAVSAQSDSLLVSSGTPDQKSLSLAVQTFNIEGFNVDGITSTLTLRAADFFNNPIIDGSQAFVTVEGGSVTSACTFTAGQCSVQVTSQNPRPANGRVSVLATVPGDESFTDRNGNGQYDAGEPFDDLGEAFLDSSEDGLHQVGEPFSDRNGNGQRDLANGIYDGILCGDVGGCQRTSGVDVRASAVLVFSTSAVNISLSPSSLTLDELSPRTVSVSISDLNGNLPPAGSTVQVTANNGTLLTSPAVTVGNSNARGPLQFDLQLIGDGEPSSGFLNVTLTTPLQVSTSRQASIIDESACDTSPAPLPPGCEGGDAVVGEISVTPDRFTVQQNDANRQANVSVGIFAGTGATRRPFRDITPSVLCTPGEGAADFVITPPASITPTDLNGATALNFRIDAGPLARGDVVCAVRAGEQLAEVRFTAATLTVSQVVIAPNSFSIGPDLVGAPLTPQVAVFADAGGGTVVPVINATPVVGACSNVGVSGFFISSPTQIAATNVSGVSTLNFVANSTATPLGTWSCPVSVGGVQSTVTFTAP